MRSIIAILLIVVSSHTGSWAQPWEIGGWIGGSNYTGDLNTTRTITYIQPAFGIHARHSWNPHWVLKSFLNYAQISATDVGSPNIFENTRGLDFVSNIVEVGAQVEFNFTKYFPGNEKYHFSPYTFIGFALFYFSPKGSYPDYPPQPLDYYSTEGQGLPTYPDRKKYSLVQPAIPIGIGIKYGINYRWNFSVEVGQRKTFFDYLDDVSTTYIDRNTLRVERGELAPKLADKSRSGDGTPHTLGMDGKQRGNSQNNDNYMFIGFSLTYTIHSVNCRAF
ncbi:MAG: outer membrane beta-barrel protein [Bacteroidetes bacterium]|nr:outer membrane beta-barrel protein [Bacteroidota bacterium]